MDISRYLLVSLSMKLKPFKNWVHETQNPMATNSAAFGLGNEGEDVTEEESPPHIVLLKHTTEEAVSSLGSQESLRPQNTPQRMKHLDFASRPQNFPLL